MKKKLLMLIVIICALFCSNITPVSADISNGWKINGWHDIMELLTKLDDGRKITLTLLNDIAIEDEIVIEAENCEIIFDTAFDYGRGYGIYANDSTKQFLVIEGDNVTVEFQHISFYGFHHDGDGGAIYVDGEHCKIKGAVFFDCKATVDGGVICLNEDYGIVEDCGFSRCSAGDDGGAIYVCAGADDCVIKDCHFLACNCESRGNAVCGDNDTKVINCTSNTNNSYKLCKVTSSTGTSLSSGNLIIISVVAVVAVVVVVILVKKRRSDKKNIKQ